MSSMIIFYVFYILTLLNINAAPGYDTSKYRLDKYSNEINKISSSKSDQETVRNLRFFLHWLINNYGYTIAQQSRRMGEVIPSPVLLGKTLRKSHHEKSKNKKISGKRNKKAHKKSKHHNGKKNKNEEIISEKLKKENIDNYKLDLKEVNNNAINAKEEYYNEKKSKIISERNPSWNLKDIISILRNKLSQFGIYSRNETAKDAPSDRIVSIELNFEVK